MRHPFRGVAVAAACIAVSLFCLVAPNPASAQDAAPAPALTLMGVNSLDPNNVVVVNRWTGPASALGSTRAQENGKDVTISSPQEPILQADLRNGVVFMMDTSESTDGSGTLAAGRSAAKAMMQALPPGTEFGVVAAGEDSQVVQPLTTDQAAVARALDALTPSGDGALWGGVASAANQFTDESDLYGSIVLITDGTDGTGVSYNDAKGAVIEAGVPVYTLAVQDGNLSTQPRSLAQESGGSYLETENATQLTQLAGQLVPSVGGLYTFSYQSNNRQGVTDLFVTVDNTTIQSSFVAGSDARGVDSLVYLPPEDTGGIAVLQNDAGKYLAILLGLVAAGLAAWAIINVAVRDQSGLASVLQPYSGGYVAQPEDDDDPAAQGMAQTAIMQRAVELTEQFAEKQGFLTRVEVALERANLPLRAAEAMFFYVAVAAVIVLATAAVTQSLIPVIIVLAAAVLVPPAVLNYMTAKRTRAFETQLPDTLQLLSGTLRAGYSMMQGVEAVSQETEEPMGRELRRVVTEARLGRPLEESLDSVAERMGSPDFGWAVMAIRIQREVGGNLSELLMTVAETMTQRERLRRDIKALTAEGRISAYVLAVMPPALALAMYIINPEYMEPLWTQTTGKIMLIGGLGLMIAGFVWMNKIVKIEV